MIALLDKSERPIFRPLLTLVRVEKLDIRPIPSATCPSESILPIRLRRDFLVLSQGFVEKAQHQHGR